MICERCGQYFKRRGVETVCSFTCYKKRKEGIKPDFVQVERRDLVKWQQQLKEKSDSGNGTVFDLCIREEFFDKYLGKGE